MEKLFISQRNESHSTSFSLNWKSPQVKWSPSLVETRAFTWMLFNETDFLQVWPYLAWPWCKKRHGTSFSVLASPHLLLQLSACSLCESLAPFQQLDSPAVMPPCSSHRNKNKCHRYNLKQVTVASFFLEKKASNGSLLLMSNLFGIKIGHILLFFFFLITWRLQLC